MVRLRRPARQRVARNSSAEPLCRTVSLCLLAADNVIMARRPHADQPPIEPREFRSVDEIDRGINKLQRRIEELRNLDARAAILEHSGADDVVRSNIKETIRDVFGPNSPEFQEHERIHIWAGPSYMGMSPEAGIRRMADELA